MPLLLTNPFYLPRDRRWYAGRGNREFWEMALFLLADPFFRAEKIYPNASHLLLHCI